MESIPVSSWRQLGNLRQATSLVEQLSPELVYPVEQHILLDGGVPRIRATIIMDSGRLYQCDFQVSVFNAMPSAEV